MEMGPKTAAAIGKYKKLLLLRKEIVRKNDLDVEERRALFQKVEQLEARLLQDPSVHAEWREAVLQLQQNKASMQKSNQYFVDLDRARQKTWHTFLEEHVDNLTD